MSKGIKISETLQDIIKGCEICQHNNPCNLPLPPARTQRKGSYPQEDWQIDFNHMPVSPHSCFLLVLMDTYTGWIEAFPCPTKKAWEVVKVLIQEIIPCFGLPHSLE
jgi:hypothetical protein